MARSRRELVRLAAVASVTALGLTLSPAAQAGTAQAGYCHLGWSDLMDRGKKSGYVVLHLRCTARNPGDKVWKINLWGDDVASDDLLDAYRLSYCVPPKEIKWAEGEHSLNEDPADRDEIYVGVWFKQANGKTYGIQSNTVADWWGLTALPGGTFQPPLPSGTTIQPQPHC